MIWRLLLLAFLSACQPAYAAKVDTWSGAGPHACLGRCSLEWAETLLTEDEIAQLEAVRARQPEPEFIPVDNGTVFSLMSYFEGKPIGYRTTTVAVLDHVEESWGWQMDGWAFVRLDACGNWAIIRGDWTRAMQPVTYADASPGAPQRLEGLSVVPVVWPTPVGPDPWTPVCCVVPPPVEPPPVSPVPLPLPGVLLGAAIAALLILRRTARA